MYKILAEIGYYDFYFPIDEALKALKFVETARKTVCSQDSSIKTAINIVEVEDDQTEQEEE